MKMFDDWPVIRHPRKPIEVARSRWQPWPSQEIRLTHPVAYRAACKYVHENADAAPQAFVAGACWSQGHADASAGRPFDHEPADCGNYRDGYEDGTEPTEPVESERER
jgi:hypothetical protein